MTEEWRCLTLSSPWPWVILHGKDVENRKQKWGYRGNVLLHGGLGFWSTREVQAFLDERVPDLGGLFSCLHSVDHMRYEGKIFARCRLSWMFEPNWRERPSSVPLDDRKRLERWHMAGQYAYLLDDVRPTPLVPVKGALGLWRPPPRVLGAALAEPCPNHPLELLDYVPEHDCWEGCAICANST